MSKSKLPKRASLEYLKKLAKDRLKELRRTDPQTKLATALLAIAREHSFSSWRALKAEVEKRQTKNVARFFEACKHEVERVSHVGDWGTQFGMLITHLSESGLDGSQVDDLNAFYREAKRRFDEDAAFKERAREAVVALQRGDPDARAAWQALCDRSREEFHEIYRRLGVEHLTAAAYQMFLGGAMLSLIGLAAGEVDRLPEQWTARLEREIGLTRAPSDGKGRAYVWGVRRRGSRGDR